LRSTAAARQHRHFGFARNLDRDAGIFAVLRDHHADRFDLVDRGVGRIAAAVELAEQHVAFDLFAQPCFEGGLGRCGVVARHGCNSPVQS